MLLTLTRLSHTFPPSLLQNCVDAIKEVELCSGMGENRQQWELLKHWAGAASEWKMGSLCKELSAHLLVLSWDG